MAKSEIDVIVDEAGLEQASIRCKVAAVLFTYRCSIACKHCCFACSGTRSDKVMTPRQCVDALAMLHETGRVIHIAGGEAMLYWDELAASLELAHQEGVEPHFVETNCSFAVDDEIVRERLEYIAGQGVKGIFASADPFHQEFVPADRFIRVRRLTKEIFGERCFYGVGYSDEEVRTFEGMTRDLEAIRAYVRQHTPVMVGSAARELARYLDDHGPEEAKLPAHGWTTPAERESCAQQFRASTMWELHIDPYNHMQTNCGIILGNVSEMTPHQLFESGPEQVNRFVRVLSLGGPLALARLAEEEYGYRMPERVSQRCELCYDTRRHLRRSHPEIFGPAEVYD